MRIAATRSLQALGEASHTEIQGLTGSRSVGVYALAGNVPQLVFSRRAPEGFLQEYDAMVANGDRLVERMCDLRHAVDAATEMGLGAWFDSHHYGMLRRWGYSHCMAGPLSVGNRVVGVIYAAAEGRVAPYDAIALQRMAILCRAGSLALENMVASGAIAPDTQVWMSRGDAENAAAGVARQAAPLADLPRRAGQVAALVLRGHSNKAIARDLGLSAHTVKDHVGALCKRLGAQNRTELAHRLAGSP